ncbi:hypothetical protein IF1G_07635 [Cordyceps javanica]|uniref:Secreted protein n=1 Tax=Cordyceps javanica TaxID=43265 RepID=A0A545UWR2_9HYPO|nr:hypothetical protein IF1G_07635 [Cordyceps javanica]
MSSSFATLIWLGPLRLARSLRSLLLVSCKLLGRHVVALSTEQIYGTSFYRDLSPPSLGVYFLDLAADVKPQEMSRRITTAEKMTLARRSSLRPRPSSL